MHEYDTDGSLNKSIAHGIVAEISSQIAGNGAGSGFTAGFTNELLIHKINEWSHGDPATAQWISAALGATVNQATGKNAESGASAAQDGTKWNYYGKRRDEEGNVLGVGKIAALLQEDGTYRYVVYQDGTDTVVQKDDLYPYTSVWIEDPHNPGYGQTWVVNGKAGDAYYSGTFSEERFNNDNKSMIYFNLSDRDEMSTIIPGLKTVQEKGDGYLTLEPKNYGDKLANDGAAIIEGIDGNHYAIGSDGKYYYTVYPVNTHDMNWHVKNAIAEETATTVPTKMSEQLVKIIGKQSISTTASQIGSLSKYVGSKVGGSIQAGFLIGNFVENHDRYTNWEYKYNADALDLGGTGLGIIAAGIGTGISGPIGGSIAGIAVSSGINFWIQNKKMNLKNRIKKIIKKEKFI